MRGGDGDVKAWKRARRGRIQTWNLGGKLGKRETKGVKSLSEMTETSDATACGPQEDGLKFQFWCCVGVEGKKKIQRKKVVSVGKKKIRGFVDEGRRSKENPKRTRSYRRGFAQLNPRTSGSKGEGQKKRSSSRKSSETEW